MRVEWSSILFPFLLLLLLLLPSTREIEQNFASSSWLAGGVTRHSFVLLLAGKIEILAGIIDVPRRSRWEYTEREGEKLRIANAARLWQHVYRAFE